MSKNQVEKQLEHAIELGKRWVEYGEFVHGWEYFSNNNCSVSVYRANNSDHTGVQFSGLHIGFHNPPSFELTLPIFRDLDNILEKAETLLDELIATDKQIKLEDRQREVATQKAQLKKRLKELEDIEANK